MTGITIFGLYSGPHRVSPTNIPQRTAGTVLVFKFYKLPIVRCSYSPNCGANFMASKQLL